MKGVECAFVGVLSKDPELKQGKNGKNYANFSCTVAVENGEPQWINVICFGSIHERALRLLGREARSGLAVSAWRAERLGNIGRNRVENPRVGTSPQTGEARLDKDKLPIALPAVKKRKGSFALFRKPKKETAQDSEDRPHERPFDDPLSF